MSDASDFYLEALLNFLQSDDWKDTIRIFIVANCHYFSHLQEFHPQQHTIWKTFQEIVENILQMTLVSIGGSFEELENALDQVLSRPSRGPKDANMQEVLQQLQTCHDFPYFTQMMHKACCELFQEEGKHIDENPYDMLMRMGFTVQLINHAYERLGKHASLEEIVMLLSAENETLQEVGYTSKPPSSSKHGGSSQKVGKAESKATSSSTKARGGAMEHKYTIDTKQDSDLYDPQAEEENGNNLQNIESALFDPYHKFITEAASFQVENIDVNELNAKFVIADSILASYRETLKHGASTPSHGTSQDDMLDLIQWAADMKTLQQDILEAYEQEIHCKDMIYNHHHGLIHWYIELEQSRQEINARHNQVAGDMLSDVELSRMAELDRIAMQGTEDEQKLHHVLSRHETVRQQITKLYKKISIIIGMNKKIKRDLVEEVYLFLKEQVANQRNLEELFQPSSGTASGDAAGTSEEAVGKLMSFKGGLEIINHFFDLHLLEDEQVFLRNEINSLIGSPSGRPQDGSKSMFGDNEAEAHFSAIFNQVEVDLSSKGLDASEPSASAAAAIQECLIAESKDDRRDEEQDLADKKLAASATATSLLKLQSASTASNPSENLIEKLKASHRSALENLKATLEADKLSQLQALETRLLMRKKKLQQLKQDASSSESKASIEEEEAVIELLEAEMKSYITQHTLKKESLVEGLKYKCMNELKLARNVLKEKGMSSVMGGNADSEDVSSKSEEQLGKQLQQQLTSLQDKITNDAIHGLKERYELEKQQLLEHFQQERLRQQQRLKARLEKKKAKGGTGGSGGGGLVDEDEELDYESRQIDNKLDRELVHSLANLRETLLLGMGGVTILSESDANDTSRVKKALPKKSTIFDEEDEDYLNDPQERILQKNQGLLSNISRLEEMKKMYVEAGDKLQRDLFAKRYNKGKKPSYPSSTSAAGGVDEDADQMTEEYEQMVTLVDQMIVNAFDSHVLDLSAGLSSADSDANASFSSKAGGKGGLGVDKKELEERIKAGILDAFEKAKGSLQEAHDYEKQRAQDKLKQRRDKGKTNLNPAMMENLLEEVVDAYLQPPSQAAATTASSKITALPEPEAPVQVQVMGSNAPRKLPTTTNHDNTNLEDEKSRILTVHNQKEKQLVDDLYASMLDKKRKLEDRMRRKKEKQEEAGSSNADAKQDSGTNMSMQGVEEDEEKKKIESLEAAFHKVISTLKHANPTTLDNMTPEQLIGMMERFAQPVQEENVTKSGSHSAAHSRPVSAGHEREAMVGEARRISTAYVEEQQKHDLMMKIQQARQKQSLQRKLWERNQARQQQMHMENVEDEENDDDDDHHVVDNSIHIGQYQSRLKNLKPYSNQPAFKMPNMPSVAEPRTTAPVNQQKMMASRGLNLGPMMRK